MLIKIIYIQVVMFMVWHFVDGVSTPAVAADTRSFIATVPPNTWVQLPGTTLKDVVGPESYREPIRGVIGPRGIVDAWNGAAWNEREQWLDLIASGGHADYCGNGYYRFDLDTLSWKRLVPPSPLKGYDWRTGRTPDGRPASRHTYQGLVYVPTTDKVYLFGGSLCSGSGAADNRIWSFTIDGKSELIGKTSGYPMLGGHALFDEKRGVVYLVKRGHVYLFDPETGKYRDLTRREADRGWGTSAALDTKRDRIFGFGHGVAWVFDIRTGKKRNLKLRGDYRLIRKKGVGIEYVEPIDRYVVWGGGGTLYLVDPEKFEFRALETKGRPPGGIGNGVYGRFRYSRKYDGFIVLSRFDQDIYFIRLGDLQALGKKLEMDVSLSMADPQAFIDQAKPGDVVSIPPGTYLKGLKVDKPLTLRLRGVNLWGISGGKGIIRIENPKGPVVIEDFKGDGKNANAMRGNLAGIRISGANFDVTVDRADISGTVMGILTDNRGGILRVIDSHLHDTGQEDAKTNLSHILYAGSIDRLIVENSTLERSRGRGHLLKSRAGKTTIRGSRLLGGNARHSRIVDIPCGGELWIEDSELVQSPKADNLDLMGFGLEKCGKGKETRLELSNTLVRATRAGSVLFLERKDGDGTVTVIDGGGNRLEGVAIKR